MLIIFILITDHKPETKYYTWFNLIGNKGLRNTKALDDK